MDAIADFFRKHDGVRADDRGIQWDTAADDVLVRWLGHYSWVVRAGLAGHADASSVPDRDRAAAKPILLEICREVERRVNDKPIDNPTIEAAYLARVKPILAEFGG